MIARANKPAAKLRPEGKVKQRSQPIDDPLLRVEEYGYYGLIGPTAAEDLDRIVYGI